MEGSLGLLGVLGGVFLGLELASKTLILSDIGVRPNEERRDMVTLGGGEGVLVVRMTLPQLFICSNLQIATCGAVK